MREGPARADSGELADTVDMATEVTGRPDESGVMARLWPALLAGTVAWSVHLVVSYYLAWAACGGGDGWLAVLRHLATLLSAMFLFTIVMTGAANFFLIPCR